MDSLPLTPVLDTDDALTFWRAADFASEAHAGQVDKGGEPYFFHVFRVGVSLLPNWAAARVGVCHDILEDCPEVKLSELLGVMQSPEEERAVLLLRRAPRQIYEEYIRAIFIDKLARRVKIADLKDNMDPRRHERARNAGHNIDRLLRRYAWASYYLGTGRGPKAGCSDCDDYGCTMNCGPAVPPEPRAR